MNTMMAERTRTAEEIRDELAREEAKRVRLVDRLENGWGKADAHYLLVLCNRRIDTLRLLLGDVTERSGQ